MDRRYAILRHFLIITIYPLFVVSINIMMHYHRHIVLIAQIIVRHANLPLSVNPALDPYFLTQTTLHASQNALQKNSKMSQTKCAQIVTMIAYPVCLN